MAATTLPLTQAEAPFVLTIDAGSSSARVLLYDRSGRCVDGVGERAFYDVQASQPGAAEFEVDQLLAQIARAVDAALEQAGPLAAQIAAVAVDTFVTSLVAVDAHGEPLTPLMTYADTRSGEDALLLRSTLDEQAVHERTGCLLRASYWPARLAWYRRTRPELWKQAARWLTLGEYLELRLFGHCRASYSVASWSGLLDRHQLLWDGPLLSSLGILPGQLSPLVDRDAALCGLLPPYADRWPPLRQVPWFPALGDGAAANVGSGCSGPSRIALTLGTTGALRKI
ncbi:MAG: FGGY family carbohydrate kinase, partial [Caldilinea sp.]